MSCYIDSHNCTGLTMTLNLLKFKPPRPSIYLVSKLHNIYQVQWGTNANKSIIAELSAILTYQKKEDDNEVRFRYNDGHQLFDIVGQDLEPSTTYVVSVKTNTSSGVLSESSNVMAFTTGKLTSLINIINCYGIIIVDSGTIVKGKLWDKAAKDEKPKLLDIKPNENVVRLLSKESLSDGSGRSGHTSGISMASSSLAYAETQPVDTEACVLAALHDVFPFFTPAEDSFPSYEPVHGSVNLPPYKKTCSPIVFDNKSYISNSPNDDVHMQKTFDSGYHSSDGPTLHDFIIPPHVSANMEMDMSYQPCAQSGEASSPSQNLLPVVYGYQGFEKLVKQSNNMSSTENAEECPSLIPDDSCYCVLFPNSYRNYHVSAILWTSYRNFRSTNFPETSHTIHASSILIFSALVSV
uniref:Fibronectin type-III domain-containing protein n=1 Tax=Neogobius melanostomus TaxID=47308 RepID=A0A8C6SLK8_9GOBI